MLPVGDACVGLRMGRLRSRVIRWVPTGELWLLGAALPVPEGFAAEHWARCATTVVPAYLPIRVHTPNY